VHNCVYYFTQNKNFREDSVLHPNLVWQRVQIVKHFIMQVSDSFSCIISLISKYSQQQSVCRHLCHNSVGK